MRLYRILILIPLVLSVIKINAVEYGLDINGNMPRNGDILKKYYLKYFKNEKTGTDIIWDFSNIEPQKKYITSIYKYKNDTCFINIENNNLKYYQLKNNRLYQYRLSAPGKVIKFPMEEMTLQFPFKYGSVFSGYFFSEGSLDLFRYIKNAGKADIAIIASGKMITPDGDSLRNVLLLKELRKSSINIAPDFRNSFKNTKDTTLLTNSYIDNGLICDSIINVAEHYYWYANGYRYPIIETRKVTSFYYGSAVDSISEAYYIPVSDQIYELSYDAYNDSIRKTEENMAFNNMFEMNTYSTKSKHTPNYKTQNVNNQSSVETNYTNLNEVKNYCQLYPLIVSNSTMLDYQINDGNNIDIKIFSTSGSLVWKKSIKTDNNCGKIDCDIHELVDGEYIVSVYLGSENYTYKIIKK